MSLELASVILTDILFIELNRRDVLNSRLLKRWYVEYGLSAVVADVAIIWLVFYGTKQFTKYKGLQLLMAIIAVQVMHDLIFYLIFSAIPRGKSKTMDFFKDYSKEIGVKAIIGDSMMLATAFAFHYLFYNIFKIRSTRQTMMVLGLSVYLTPYFLHG